MSPLCFDLKSQGRDDKFMIGLMESSSVRTNVQDTGVEALVDKDVVNHVARSRTIAISEPSSTMEELMLEPGVGYNQLS